jgi:hypothetical protein
MGAQLSHSTPFSVFYWQPTHHQQKNKTGQMSPFEYDTLWDAGCLL